MRKQLSFIANGLEKIRIGMSKTLAVLGSPIAHSKSPQIQLAALNHLGISATFDRFEVTDLAGFLATHPNFDALSLTMPLKEQARIVADWEEPLVAKTNSANYLLKSNGLLKAFNTDVFGIVKAVQNVSAHTVGILGTGATARCSLAAMEGKELRLWGRKSETLAELANQFDCTPSEIDSVLQSDLVISTLPGDALADLVGQSQPGVLLDVVYSRQSPAGFAGYISGLEMLVWQAIGQLRILLNGADVPLENEEELAEIMMNAAKVAE